MAGPNVTATISAVDQATAVLQGFARNARAMASQLDKIASSAGGASNKTNDAMAAMASRSAVAATQMRSNAAGIATSFGLIATAAGSAWRRVADISREISDITSKMQAYGAVSAEAIRGIMRTGSTGPMVGYQGGMAGYTRAAYAASRANLSNEAAAVAAKHGVKFGDLINENSGDATEKLLQLGSMLNMFRDEKGRPTTADRLTPAQLDKQLAEARGRYVQLARRMPGKESDIFEFYKMFGPSAEAFGMDPDEQKAFMVLQANKGLTGSHAGTYARGIIQRAVPTAKGLQAMTSLGLDPGKYMALDRSAMNTENVIGGVEARFGTLNDATKKAARAAIERFTRGETNTSAYAREFGDALTLSGHKSLQDRSKAMKYVWDSFLPFVTKYNVVGELNDAVAAGAGPGYSRARFGIESGTGALAIALQDLNRTIADIRRERETTSGARVADEADLKRQESFAFQLDKLMNGLTAMMQRLFEPWQGYATGVLQGLNALVDTINGAGDGVRKFTGAVVAATVALAAMAGVKAVGGVVGGIAAGVAGGAAGGGVAGAVTGGAVGWTLRRMVGGAMRGMLRGGAIGTGLYLGSELVEGVYDAAMNDPNQLTADERAQQSRIDEIDRRIAAAGSGSGMAAVRVNEWRAERDRLAARIRIKNAFRTPEYVNGGGTLGPAFDPGLGAADFPDGKRFGNLPFEPIGRGAGTPQDVSVTGEATIVQNATIEVGLKPEVVNMIQSLKMGLHDAKMGRSMGGSNGAAPRSSTGRVAGPN